MKNCDIVVVNNVIESIQFFRYLGVNIDNLINMQSMLKRKKVVCVLINIY